VVTNDYDALTQEAAITMCKYTIGLGFCKGILGYRFFTLLRVTRWSAKRKRCIATWPRTQALALERAFSPGFAIDISAFCGILL
jgi:hypothetical protein